MSRRRRLPRWLIFLLLLLLLLFLILICWLLILPRLQQPPATDTPVPITEVVETPDVTEVPDLTDTPEVTEFPDVTEVPDVTETPEVTETPPPEETDVIPPDPADLLMDNITPDFTLTWDANCNNYTISANLDLLVRNQGASPSSTFAVSFAIYNEAKLNPLSNLNRLNFGDIAVGASESQVANLTATISRTQIQSSHNNIYLIINVDVDKQVDEIDETNNTIVVPIEIKACGKGA